MKKIYYRKLIRDAIPEILEAKKSAYSVRILNVEEFEKALLKNFWRRLGN